MYTGSRAGPARGVAVGTKGSGKREMAAGKDTGKTGLPPLIGKHSTTISTTLSIKIRTSYLVHKH
jgi:hypothetical protein